jgi:tetratricopeptide (TPR) repeat protein
VTSAPPRPASRAPRRGAEIALALGASAACLAYDPHAAAAEPKRALALVVALAAIGALVVESRRAEQRELRAPIASLAAAGFVALALLSATFGLPSGQLDLAPWIAAAGLAAAAARLGEGGAVRVARLAGAVVGGGASLLAIGAFARGGRGFDLHGGQGNPNWLGLLLAVCLPLTIDAAASLARERRSIVTAVAAILGLAEAFALYLAHSRVAWCATLLALLFVVVAHLRDRGRRRLAVGAASAALGLAILVASASSSPARADVNAISNDVPAGVSIAGRAWIYRVALTASGRALPFGQGLGRFGHAFLDAQGDALRPLPPAEAARRFVNATTAHDDLLQAAVESGPIAALLLAAAVVAAAAAHARGRWLAGAAVFVALGVTMLGDSPLRQPAVVIVVGLVIGALPARGARIRLPFAARRAGLLALGALMSWNLATCARAWIATTIRTAARESAPAVRLRELARSAAIDRGSGEALLDLGLAELAVGDAEAAIRHLERSRALLANVGTDVALGEALLASDDAERALAAYRRALARNPGSARAHAGVAEASRSLGRLDEAEQAATVARSLLPGDARIRALLDRIREARMDAP